MMKLSVFCVLSVLGTAISAMAEPVMGTWVSPPDSKGLVGHVEVAKCGPDLCGILKSAHAQDGQSVRTPSVGKTLLHSLRPVGNGQYSAMAYVPLLGKTVPAEIHLAGNTLTVRGCAGPICKSQTWSRLK